MSKVTSLSNFKADASRMLARMRKSGEALVLTQNGEATAVVQDVDTYRKMQNALLMLKLVAQGEADIRNGDVSEQRDVFEAIEKNCAGMIKGARVSPLSLRERVEAVELTPYNTVNTWLHIE